MSIHAITINDYFLALPQAIPGIAGDLLGISSGGFLLHFVFPFAAMYAYGFRARLRERFGLPVTCGSDCCLWFMCTPCAYK